ncbi:hypothetical protein Tco_1210721, partial [Tanacetum coccineum]
YHVEPRGCHVSFHINKWVPPANMDATWTAMLVAASQSDAATWRDGWQLIIKLQLAAAHDLRVLEGVGGSSGLVEERIYSWLSTRMQGSCGINEIKRVISLCDTKKCRLDTGWSRNNAVSTARVDVSTTKFIYDAGWSRNNAVRMSNSAC